MKKTIVHLCIIIFVSLICYYETLSGSFMFDDIEAIVKNKDCLNETPIKNIFLNDFWGTPIEKRHSHKSYRPITILSFRLNNYLNPEVKPDPFYYHCVNVILYTILCVLFYFAFDILFNEPNSKTMVFYCTLLFTVHPIHVECIDAIVGRADVLSAIFYIIAFIFYHHSINLKSYGKNKIQRGLFFICTIFSAILSMLSKETGITVLALCFIYDLHLNGCLLNFLNPRKKCLNVKYTLIVRLSVIFIAILILLYFRWWIMNFNSPTFQKMDNPASFSPFLFVRVFTYNYIYFLNLLLLIWPQWLCFDWAMGCIRLIINFNDFRICFVVLFWIFIALSIYKCFYSKMSETFMAIVIMVVTFLPASNILRVGFVVAERILILPSAGFCMLITIGLNNLKKKIGICIYITYFGVLIIFILKIHLRNQDWLNEKLLYNSALNVCPNNAKVHYNIAKIAADRGDVKIAEYEYRQAISLYPEYDHAMNNLANILRDNGNLEEAEYLLKKALKIRPKFAAAWMNLGIVQMNKELTIEAEQSLLNALKYRSKYADCYYNLGNLYLNTNRQSKAMEAWKAAIQLQPTHSVAWSNLLILLDSLNRIEEAILIGKQAIKLLPNEPSLHFNLANSLGKAKKLQEAETHFLIAIRLNPTVALYYSNLGVLYHRWNKYNEAENYYKIALKLDPNLKSAHDNLKLLSKILKND